MERAEEEVNIWRGGAWLSEEFISCTWYHMSDSGVNRWKQVSTESTGRSEKCLSYNNALWAEKRPAA